MELIELWKRIFRDLIKFIIRNIECFEPIEKFKWDVPQALQQIKLELKFRGIRELIKDSLCKVFNLIVAHVKDCNVDTVFEGVLFKL